MALRLVIAVFAALRAVLIYGEAGVLASRPVDVRRRQRVRGRRQVTHTPSVWDFRGDATSPVRLGVR